MLPIIKNLTSVNRILSSSKINRYIVLHDINHVGTAESISFENKDVYSGYSYNFIVDEDTIIQQVEEKDVSLHCGCNFYHHPFCKNNNSISIAMCQKSSGVVSNKTIQNTADVVRYLMDKYDIPANNLLRHYDVSRKLCPSGYVETAKWKELKALILGVPISEIANKFDPTVNPYPIPERVLYKGCVGDDVRWTQFELNTYDLNGTEFNLDPDGVFGNGVKGAVGIFQQQQGLEVNYKVDLPTRKRLIELSTTY